MEPVRVRWVEGMQFVSVAGSGHAVVLDAGADDGGANSGPCPTEMLLMALGGCTGMDIVQILRKGRVDVQRFEMRVYGERAETSPRKFVKIRIECLLWGHDIPADKVERAITLSKEKYCSVGATLEGAAEIETSYQIMKTSRR